MIGPESRSGLAAGQFVIPRHLLYGLNLCFGPEAEVASYPAVTAVSASGLVSLDRHRQSSQPAQAPVGPAGGDGFAQWQNAHN
jgi:hypothetical protein